MGDPRHQAVDIALGAIEIVHLSGDPLGRQTLLGSGEVSEDMRQQPRMAVGHDFAEIRDLAHLPEQPHRTPVAGKLGDVAVAGERLQRAVVVGLPRLDKAGQGRALVEALQQGFDRFEVQPGVAPVQPGQWVEAVGFYRLDNFAVERPLLGSRAKGAVAHMTPGAAGDLSNFGGG